MTIIPPSAQENVRPSPSARAMQELEINTLKIDGAGLKVVQKELEKKYPKGSEYPKVRSVE